MSWLYTIVFAGLMFSSPEAPTASADTLIQEAPAPLRSVVRDETERFEQTYPLNADGTVHVSNVNGSITVEAWDRNEVRLEYIKTGETRERLSSVEVRIESRPDRLSATTDYGNSKMSGASWNNNGRVSVEFRLMAPKGAVIREIGTVNGSVAVSGFTNTTKISAVNGSATAKNLSGTAHLSTVNGEVTADFDRLAAGGRISLNTVNGRVRLLIPSDSNATIKADSLNGEITNDFGLPVRKGKYVGRDMYGRLGSGDVQIKLNSVNGALSVGRKSDGAAASPSVNLLPEKDKADENWDSDDDHDRTSVDAAKFDRQIARQVKAAEKAEKTLERQLEEMGPGLEKAAAEAARGLHVLDRQRPVIDHKVKEKLRQLDKARGQLAMFDAGGSVSTVEKKSNAFTVKGIPLVTVSAIGCSVSVRGWDRSEVQYNVTRVSARRDQKQLQMTEQHNESSVTINIENPDEVHNGMFPHDGSRTRIEIFVPRKSNLKVGSDGEIRLEGITGDVQLSGEDEAINVRDLDGQLSVTSVDGRVRVVGFRGDIDAETSDGMISLEGDFQKLNARSTDGAIMLTVGSSVSASLNSNCSPVMSDGIVLTKVTPGNECSSYKISDGRSRFVISTGGEISVRASDVLNASN